MENYRLKQAQELIIKSSKKQTNDFKLKTPQSGVIDVKTFEKIFKEIIHAEEFIYSSLPSHELSISEAEEFTKYLILARNEIDSILVDFKVIEKQEDVVDINKLTENILFITSKNNLKKVLKKLGVDVQKIIVASVPLNIEDMKELNPKIPEQAIKGIETKVEHIHNDINRKIKSLNPEKLIVLAEDDLNGQLLAKRAKEQYNALIYLNNNLKDLTDVELIEIVEGS